MMNRFCGPRQRIRWNAGLLLALTFAVGGCGNQATTDTTGQVTLDGKPVAGAEVTFISKDDGGKSVHTAATDSTGAFTIKEKSKTNTPFTAGKYTVLVKKMSMGGGMDSVKNELPEVYSSRENSPIVIDVKDPAAGIPTIEVKSKPPESKAEK